MAHPLVQYEIVYIDKPSGKRLHNTMENHHFFNGKTHYQWQFSIAMLNYRRVYQYDIFEWQRFLKGFIYPVKSRMMSYVTSVRATRPPLCCLSYTDHQLSLIAPPLWLILFMFSCNTPKFSEMFPQIEETAFKHLLQDVGVSNIFIFSGA
jgi:hypothetical protein